MSENILVILRVRPRNQREIRENALVSCSVSSDSRQVVVKHTADLTKSFTFDRVYGPNSTQEQVFLGIKPVIDQVFLGYNCTVFAYGQTGAGKTWTMEGDLTPQSFDAGIIPRTLYTLFDKLESECSDYSVKVSYTELYNEELKDLLSPDNEKKLKLFEDLSRKGAVVIQGVEEVVVKNAADVVTVLQQGALKRQIAATKMNDVSSRSHAIFTITVHIKEATSDGEELLKVGKLHLVDLAGSENIGRSGAVQGRAKEAGMINQSLLTLGRVINALVERSAHVPYRESKLTRILQDSLGGRTKTCIIANISPAKDSLEETLSTLDYAHRAKNIRNKPEVNQKLTKRALIRDYANQIERLKADLIATREKNGIFLTPDSYNMLVSENAGNKTLVEEVTKTIQAKQEEIKEIQERFNGQTSLLKEKSSKLDEAMADLETKQKELEFLLNETKVLTEKLSLQEYFTKAHANTEVSLNDIASGMQQTVKSNISDLEGLHQKIERKTNLEKENQRIFRESQKMLYEKLTGLTNQFNKFQSSFSDLEQESKSRLENYESLFKNSYEQLKSAIGEQDSKLKKLKNGISMTFEEWVQQVELKNQKELELLGNFHEEMTKTFDDFHKNQKEQFDMTFNDFNQKLVDLKSNISDLFNNLTQYLERSDSFIEASMMSQKEFHCNHSEMINLQIEKLNVENQSLLNREPLIQNEIQDACSNFINLMQSKFKEFQSFVNLKLSNEFEVEKRALNENNLALNNIDKLSNENYSKLSQDQQQFKEILSEQVEILNKQKHSFDIDIDEAKEKVKTRLNSLNSINENKIGEEKEKVADSIENLKKRKIEEFEEVELKKQKKLLEIEDHVQHLGTVNKILDEKVDEKESKVQSLVEISKKEKFEFENIVELYTRSLNENLEACHNVLQTKDLMKDISTGKTPRKKTIKYPESWELTKPYEELEKEFKQDLEQKENEFSNLATSGSKLPTRITRSRGSTLNDNQSLE